MSDPSQPPPVQPGGETPQQQGVHVNVPIQQPWIPQNISPAELPCGFWKRVDYMLHHPDEVMESIRRDADLFGLSMTFLQIAIVMGALYGAVMGATNLLQGSDMVIREKLLLILITATKVPVLFLLTLAIVLPPVYISNAFAGARMSFQQMLCILLSSTAMTLTVLASMATVAFFFALTSKSYDFLKLLHVAFFAYAGLVGIRYLGSTVRTISWSRGRRMTGSIFVLWLLLYMFVGTQLAWVLRPFVGSPNEKFQVLRPRSGNFYESVLHSIGKVGPDGR